MRSKETPLHNTREQTLKCLAYDCFPIILKVLAVTEVFGETTKSAGILIGYLHRPGSYGYCNPL